MHDLQTYTINQAKVVFLNHRPQSKLMRPGAADACQTCRRGLREGCSFCSLACKVELLVNNCRLTRQPSATASDDSSECTQDHYRDPRDAPTPPRKMMRVGNATSSSRRSSDESAGSGSESHGQASHCSRRKQMHPKRSAWL
eukprot:jgi/Chrzof1/5862/Cz16g18150.t1